MSSTSLSEIKKFFEAATCSDCQKKNKSKLVNKMEYICTHAICKDSLTIVCKSCHEQYHEFQFYSLNKRYIQNLQDFLEELYYFIKTENDKFDLINVIIKSASTLLPENYPNYEEMFALFNQIKLDINTNQLRQFEEILECVNSIFMTEEYREQIEKLHKIKEHITYNSYSKFQLLNNAPFEDLERNFTNKLKESISKKNIEKNILVTFITQRQRKISLYKNQQNKLFNNILEKVSEVHKECIMDRKENCKGNNKNTLTHILDPCNKGSSSPSCEECIDAFDFYNKKLEAVF